MLQCRAGGGGRSNWHIDRVRGELGLGLHAATGLAKAEAYLSHCVATPPPPPGASPFFCVLAAPQAKICASDFTSVRIGSKQMGSKFPMIPIPQAQAIVLEQTRALGSEAVPLQDALGRILYAPVTSPDSVPPFPASVKVQMAMLLWPAMVLATSKSWERQGQESWMKCGCKQGQSLT
eukprot:1158418-Pelagomonas_calceolata.AAC.4